LFEKYLKSISVTTKPTYGRVQEEFEDIKGVIRIRKSKDRQHNRQKDKTMIFTHQTKDRVNRIPFKTGTERMSSGRVTVPVPLVAPVVFL